MDKAVNHYSEALRINPGFALVYNDMGSALLRSRRIEETLFCFREATILESGNIEAHWNLKNVKAQKFNAGRELSKRFLCESPLINITAPSS